MVVLQRIDNKICKLVNNGFALGLIIIDSELITHLQQLIYRIPNFFEF